MKFRSFLLAMMLCALCVTQASALEYTFDAPEDYLFGQSTSDDTIYEWENPNVDRSKNTALIAPGFGTPPAAVNISPPTSSPARCLAGWSIRWAAPTSTEGRRAAPLFPVSTPR